MGTRTPLSRDVRRTRDPRGVPVEPGRHLPIGNEAMQQLARSGRAPSRALAGPGNEAVQRVPAERANQAVQRALVGSSGTRPIDPLLLQRVAGNSAVSHILQRQKTPGRYQLTNEARLRDDAPPNYPVLRTIPRRTHVQVRDKGIRTSNFKAGHKTNEHSWSTWQATSGWIEDSKLTAAPEPQQLPAHASPPPLSIPATPASTAISRPSVPAYSAPKPTPAPPRRPQTAAIGIGGNKRQVADDLSMGSSSFQQELESPHDLSPLLGNVRVTEVKSADQSKLTVTIIGDRLYTHDGRYRLDSGRAEIRYVLCRVGDGGLQLYASQMFHHENKADTSENALHVDLIGTYPFMESHAQVTGTVIGAGDFVVQDGRITRITNKSGTWHPRGSHLAAALRAMTAWQVLDASLVRTGEIPVKQFLPGSDPNNPDEGALVTLDPRHLHAL
jgi:hypothetical protein